MAKIILVTGGNRGIGLEICRQLAEAGHTVILGARKTTQGLKASKNFKGNIDVQPLDVISEQSIEQVADYVNKQYGKLDVLINEELYDLNTDPEEWYNITDSKEFEQIKKQLAGFLPAAPLLLPESSLIELMEHHVPPVKSKAYYFSKERREWLERFQRVN